MFTGEKFESIHFDLIKKYDFIPEFEKAILLDPKSLASYWNIGETYRNLGRYDKALEYLTKAKQLVLNVRGTRLVVDVTDQGLGLNDMKIPGTKKLSLRVVADNTSIDVFFGEHGLFYSPKMVTPTSKTVSVEAIGGAVTFSKLQSHELKSIWK